VFSEFFLKKWNEWVDVSEEGLKDAQVKRYVENLIKLRMLRFSSDHLHLCEGVYSFLMVRARSKSSLLLFGFSVPFLC